MFRPPNSRLDQVAMDEDNWKLPVVAVGRFCSSGTTLSASTMGRLVQSHASQATTKPVKDAQAGSREPQPYLSSSTQDLLDSRGTRTGKFKNVTVWLY